MANVITRTYPVDTFDYESSEWVSDLRGSEHLLDTKAAPLTLRVRDPADPEVVLAKVRYSDLLEYVNAIVSEGKLYLMPKSGKQASFSEHSAYGTLLICADKLEADLRFHNFAKKLLGPIAKSIGDTINLRAWDLDSPGIRIPRKMYAFPLSER